MAASDGKPAGCSASRSGILGHPLHPALLTFLLGLLALRPSYDSLARVATLLVVALEASSVIYLAVAASWGGTTASDAPPARVRRSRTSSSL
jgi:hypothetical protein